jgi:hypothetical protein
VKHSPDRSEIIGSVAGKGSEVIAQTWIGLGAAQSRHEL